MQELAPIDIAEAIGMSHQDFANLIAIKKCYYFHLVHYGENDKLVQAMKNIIF